MLEGFLEEPQGFVGDRQVVEDLGVVRISAVRLLEALPELNPVFGLSSRQLDALFRKSRDKAQVIGLTFHDSRHAAITRLSKKLDVLALAKMVGHTDIRMLMVYYDESAEELARRLD